MGNETSTSPVLAPIPSITFLRFLARRLSRLRPQNWTSLIGRPLWANCCNGRQLIGHQSHLEPGNGRGHQPANPVVPNGPVRRQGSDSCLVGRWPARQQWTGRWLMLNSRRVSMAAVWQTCTCPLGKTYVGATGGTEMLDLGRLILDLIVDVFWTLFWIFLTSRGNVGAEVLRNHSGGWGQSQAQVCVCNRCSAGRARILILKVNSHINIGNQCFSQLLELKKCLKDQSCVWTVTVRHTPTVSRCNAK